MKKASKQMIALIYTTNEESPKILPQTIKQATAKYDDDEGDERCFKYFKEHIKYWRFVGEARIKGVSWQEVWEHFKDPNEEANREAYLKEWAEEKEKLFQKDTKFNQKFIDLIQDDMTKLIRMLAVVDDQDGCEMNVLAGFAKYDDCFSKDIFSYEGIDQIKKQILSGYGDLLHENGIKSVRWEHLKTYFKRQLNEAEKHRVSVRIKDVNFFLNDIRRPDGAKETIEKNGGHVVDKIEDAHIVLGDYIAENETTKGMLYFNDIQGMTEFCRHPNSDNAAIDERDKIMKMRQAGGNFSI
jgi:hypothetical protein